MVDKIVAPLAILLFLAFVAFLAVYVNEIDLWVVVVAVSAMGVLDFWLELRGRNNNNSKA